MAEGRSDIAVLSGPTPAQALGHPGITRLKVWDCLIGIPYEKFDKNGVNMLMEERPILIIRYTDLLL